MSFFDRFRAGPAAAAAAPTAQVETKASAGRAAAYLFRAGVEQYSPADYKILARKHRHNPIVRRARALIAESVASIEPIVQINGRKAEDYGSAGRRLLERLRRPNPEQDRSGLFGEVAAHYVLCGDAMIEHVSGISDYSEFWSLRPELMTITPERNGQIRAYTYRPTSGGVKRWDVSPGRPSPILHIRDFNPDGSDVHADIRGQGCLVAAQMPLEVYEQAQALARALFKNGAIPSGALVYDPQQPSGAGAAKLTDEQYNRLKQQIETQYSGTANAGRPMLLDGGLDWRQFGMSLVDLQAVEIKNSAAREAALAFGIPPMLLNIPGDSTYNNYQEANRAFYRTTVLPVAKKLYSSYARWLERLWRFEGLELKVEPDQIFALAEEVAQLRGQADASPSLTVDEKRERWGLPPLPTGGDRLLVSAGLTPIEQVISADLFDDQSQGAPALPAPDDKR